MGEEGLGARGHVDKMGQRDLGIQWYTRRKEDELRLLE
jgi:hypothetical protein